MPEAPLEMTWLNSSRSTPGPFSFGRCLDKERGSPRGSTGFEIFRIPAKLCRAWRAAIRFVGPAFASTASSAMELQVNGQTTSRLFW